jgi:hypothetical protein
VYPPVGVSLARGLGAVVTSPPLVASSLLAVLPLWALFAAAGIQLGPAPGAMALVTALPPIHSFFLDFRLAAGGPDVTGSTVALGAALGVLILRALLLGFWTSLISEALLGVHRRWTDSVRHGFKGALQSFVRLFVIEAGFLSLAMAALFLGFGFLGAGLGNLAVLGGLVASLYFFVFTPVIATLEGGRVRWIARASIRAARIPGPRHMLLAFAYLAVALFISTLTPGSRVAEATPSIIVWSYVLFMGLVHMATLGAFVYRWLIARDVILAELAEEAGSPRPTEREHLPPGR